MVKVLKLLFGLFGFFCLLTLILDRNKDIQNIAKLILGQNIKMKFLVPKLLFKIHSQPFYDFKKEE